MKFLLLLLFSATISICGCQSGKAQAERPADDSTRFVQIKIVPKYKHTKLDMCLARNTSGRVIHASLNVKPADPTTPDGVIKQRLDGRGWVEVFAWPSGNKPECSLLQSQYGEAPGRKRRWY